MSDITLTEALNSARQMSNFFKAFKKIEEVVEFGAMLEQNIKELEIRKTKLISEIGSLIEKKDSQEKYFSEDSAKFSKTLEDLEKQFEHDRETLNSNLRIAKDEFEEQKRNILLEIDAIKTSKTNALVDQGALTAKMLAEKNDADEYLMAIKKEIEKIKDRLV